ncbi:AraC family transcriptional regulator [Paenibacillus oralis]|uniref:AraC family transcriptional regulator n=2 Tax=Paenibacillus oralis TaxID=2490856 RepID=A0A3P3TZH4_9BACL|nr:AraC family transcriptional regulator [Paenibacillus oralis]
MFRMKFKFLLQNKQTRLILLLTVFVPVCITSIGLYSYSQYRSGLDTELNAPNVELLQINLDVTNRAFREADNEAVDISYDPGVLSYIFGQASGREPSVQELRSYLHSRLKEPDIHSVHLVRFRDRTVISTRFEGKPAWADASDSHWSGWIQEIRDKPLLIKRRVYGNGGETGESNPKRLTGQTEVLSLVRPVVRGGEVGGAVIVNLDYDSLFSKTYTHLSDYQFVFNLDGELIYPKLNLPFTSEEMRGVIADLDVRPFDYVKVRGQDYMANQAFSDVTGWRLVSLVPLEELLKSVTLTRNVLLLFSLVSAGIGCAAMYYYNYAAFRPLKRINALLQAGQESPGRGSLYELEHVLVRWVGDFRIKSLVAEQSLPELRSKLIGEVLSRAIGSREMQAKWGSYFQDWTAAPLAMLIISIDRYQQFAAEYREEDRMLLKYAMDNIVREKLEPFWRCVTMPADHEDMAVLLQPKEEALEACSYKDAAGQLIQAIREYLHLSVSIGIGGEVSHLPEINRSYAEAKEALSYRLYDGYGQARDYRECSIRKDGIPSTLHEGWKTEMFETLQTSGEEQSIQLMRRWMRDICGGRIHPENVYKFVDQLMVEMLNMAEARGLPVPNELDDYTWQKLTTMELAEAEALLCLLAGTLTRELESRKQTKEFILARRMIGFMEQNYQANIGLQEIADHVNMGISSVSSIFKTETGSTIYDYLTSLRMDKACELLQDTSLKVADIAFRVGYQNENSFIRAFRKNKSMTPGKYRETNKFSGEYADPANTRKFGIFEDS